MSTQGHEKEAVNVEGLKAALKSSGNKAIYNEAICSTAGGTAAKVTNTVPPSFSLVSGAKILVKFTYAITAANATLQVGTNAAKPIFYHGAALAANLVKAGTSLLFVYDGTNFNIVGDINTDTTYQVMGASGANHASGLVPDTPSEAGTTKFLREDGTWQEPAGQNYSAGDGIDITNNEISVDSTVIYTKTQVDGQFIVIVNSNTEPTESTLTYTSTDGTTKNFKVGDEVRIPDAEADNGYTFYKLYALTTDGGITTATWDKLGAGGGSSVDGTITVNLVPVVSGSQYAASMLNGVTVELWNVSDNKTVETKTWAGSQLSFTKVMAAKTYKLKFAQKYGYATPQDSQEFVLGVGETYNVGTVEYQADKYVLNVSTNQDNHSDLAQTVIRVSATGISADDYLDFTGAQSDVEVLVPKGTTPTASCNSGQPSVNNYKQTISVVAATNPSGSTPTTGSITALYETEILTVSITNDSGSGDMSTPTITVKNGNTTIGTLHNGDSLKIAYDINYICTASDLEGYSTPASITKNWANTTAKSLTFLYEEAAGVDLGLPSGRRWADTNVGANNPWEFGLYFSWGNVVGHAEGSGYNFDQTTYNGTPGAALTGDIAVGTTYDAARAIMGGSWRMPTKEEFQELYDNTVHEWVASFNGVAGMKFMKKSDHSVFIFLPASGSYNGTTLYNRGTSGSYWSRSMHSSYVSVGHYLNFSSNKVNPQATSGRHFGYPVRAVQ